uniref:Uncharacterized protein n=1 Tax=Salix viminalis TaxID=40686 RepID=A0A6N2MR09_SALVM
MLRNGSLGKSLIFFFHKHEVTQWCCYHVWIPSVDLDVKPLQCLEDDSELLRQPILFVCGWFSSERNCRMAPTLVCAIDAHTGPSCV